MKSSVVRTAIVSSVITAVVVSALSLWGLPRVLSSRPNDELMQPALYNGPSSPTAYSDRAVQASPAPRRVVYRPKPSAAVASQPAPVQVRDPYGEPVVTRPHRSTGKSVLIVAGSAGTGAAIGALAGGGKGAGIGALAGGAAGLIYDRLTANK